MIDFFGSEPSVLTFNKIGKETVFRLLTACILLLTAGNGAVILISDSTTHIATETKSELLHFDQDAEKEGVVPDKIRQAVEATLRGFTGGVFAQPYAEM